MYAVELPPDTLLIVGVQLTAVDGLSDDGDYARLVLARFEGTRNSDPDGERVAIPMALRAEAMERLASGLRNVATNSNPLDPDRAEFTEWILSCRENMPHEPSDGARKAVDVALGLAGETLGFDVSDKPTIEAMLFGVAAGQAIHVAVSGKEPDDEGFGDSIVGAYGLMIDALTRRLPGFTR